MNIVHPNIADPDAFADFEVIIKHSPGRRRLNTCVETGELLQPMSIIWIVPERRTFYVRLFTDYFTPEGIERVERTLRKLPDGEWTRIRHWADVSLPDRVRYAQTRGRLVDFDFKRLELEMAINNAIEEDLTVTEMVERMRDTRNEARL